MALFVGLDVSLKTVSICIVKTDGTVVWEGKALSEPAGSRALRGFFSTPEAC